MPQTPVHDLVPPTHIMLSNYSRHNPGEVSDAFDYLKRYVLPPSTDPDAFARLALLESGRANKNEVYRGINFDLLDKAHLLDTQETKEHGRTVITGVIRPVVFDVLDCMRTTEGTYHVPAFIDGLYAVSQAEAAKLHEQQTTNQSQETVETNVPFIHLPGF